jgi:chromosome segregation ATPase
MLPVLLLIATLVVVGLLVAVLLRMGARFDAMRAEVERLRVVQRDMSSDVRARLEEGARSWESVDSEVRPRLDQLEPSVADLSASLDEHLPALATAHKRLEEVEARTAEAEARTAETEARVVRALETGSEEEEERFERLEAAVRTLRNAADERLADLAARVSTLESRSEEVRLALAVAKDEADLEESTRDGDLQAVEESELEPVAAGTPSPDSRGTGRARKSGGGRWMLVVLVLATGLALALLS